jgi:predicted dienelactone hydrolase
MRFIDITLIIVVVVAAVAQMAKLGTRWSRTFTFLAVLVAAWHIIWKGTPWQLFPVLAGLALLVGWQLIPLAMRFSRKYIVFAVLALALTSFGSLLLVPMFSLPQPTGPYSVGTRIIYLKDTSRVEDQGSQPGKPRELIVQIWYPAASSNNHLAAYQRTAETTLATSYRGALWTNSRTDAPVESDGSPFPVLLFNHRWGGIRTQNTFLTEDLASHGYVVASIDHTYNAGRVAMPDGRVIMDAFGYGPINPAERSADQIRDTWNKEIAKWIADEIFVLNTLREENLDQASPWYGRLDTNRAGAIGHSFGGAASVQLCSVDSRIRSAINIDGWTFGDIRHRASAQPVMFLYSSNSVPRPQDLNSHDAVARTEAELDVRDAKQIDSSLQQYGGYKLYVSGTSHLDFTDHSLVSPWRNWIERGHISPAQIQTIVRTYVLAFFDETLRGQKPSLLQSENPSPYSEVHIEQFTPKPIVSPVDGIGSDVPAKQ